MSAKKQRSEAQKAADARYFAKNSNKYRVLCFNLPAAEAREIEDIIAATGLSKAEFLRQAARNFKQ